MSGVTAVAAGGWHNLALKSDGTVVGWGDNGAGQATPPAGLTDVIAIAAGFLHSLALNSDGTVVGWGSNLHGQGRTAGRVVRSHRDLRRRATQPGGCFAA